VGVGGWWVWGWGGGGGGCLGAMIIGCVVYGIQLGWGCVVSGLVCLTSSGFSSVLFFSVGFFFWPQVSIVCVCVCVAWHIWYIYRREKTFKQMIYDTL